MTAEQGREPEFEALLSELSTAFVAVPPADVDTEIERWLGWLVVFLGVDRSGIGQVSLDGRELRATHSWAVEGVPTFPPVVLDSQFPWYVAEVRQGRILKFEHFPDGIPEEAAAERAYVKATSFKSPTASPSSGRSPIW